MRILHTQPLNTKPHPEAIDAVVKLLASAVEFGDTHRATALAETLTRHVGKPNRFVPPRLRRELQHRREGAHEHN